MKQDNSVESVKKAFERLEAIPEEIEERVNEILKREGITSRLHAEQVYKQVASDVFESGEPDLVKDTIKDYFFAKYREKRERVHESIMSDPQYLENLFSKLEDPEITDEKTVYTDSFGNGVITERSGLENELSRYFRIDTDSHDTILKRAEQWISGEFNDIIRSSGYNTLEEWIEYLDFEISNDEEVWKAIAEYEDLFLQGLGSESERVQKKCVMGLGVFMAMKGRINPDQFKPYEAMVRIANDPDDPNSRTAQFNFEIIYRVENYDPTIIS